MGGNKADANLIDKTDVFSYGVVAYQVFTQKVPFSEPPHDKWTNQQIEAFLRSGKRLQIPSSIPQPIIDLINDCWIHEPKDRPSMEKIAVRVQHILSQLEPLSDNNDLRADFRRETYPPVHQSSNLQRTGFSDGNYPTNVRDGNYPIDPPQEEWDKVGWAGAINREVAESRLGSAPVGTFLVRWSHHTMSYVMSYQGGRSPGEKGVEHIADIKPENGKITVIKTNKEKREFLSLIDYVEAMRRQKVVTVPLVNDYAQTPISNYNDTSQH